MAIRYLSAHDTPDDPGGLIREVLDSGAAFQGPAEDILLAWTLRLDDGRDPAEVAGRLLRAYGRAEGPLPDGACGRLVALLREAAAAPRGQLHGHRPRRRGGRRRSES
jgi:hypothetical protein